jgi:anti-sigma factor RsiW
MNEDLSSCPDDLLLAWIDGEELTDEERVRIEAHVPSCVACQGQILETRKLSSDLRVLQNLTSRSTLHRRRAGVRLQLMGGALAGIVVLVASIITGVAVRHVVDSHIATSRSGVRQGPIVQSRTSESRPLSAGQFVPLPFSNADLPAGGAAIVRVELPVTALVSVGLRPAVFDDASRVQVDLLLGADGLARAIRIAP